MRFIGGMLQEKESVLGINGSGALGTDNSRTYFVGSTIEYTPIKPLTLSASYYYGRSQTGKTNSIISFSDVLSDSFAFDVRYQMDNEKLFGLQFASPLRIKKGKAYFNIPTGRDSYSDTVYYDTMKVGLKPMAREYDLGFYFRNQQKDYNWRGEFMARFNPDHISGIKPDYRLMFGSNFDY